MGVWRFRGLGLRVEGVGFRVEGFGVLGFGFRAHLTGRMRLTKAPPPRVVQ